MNWGTVSVKDIAELAVLAIGVIWHFARIEARLLIMEKLVQMLVARSGMTAPGGDE